MRGRLDRKGLTLIEIIVVLVVMGVIGALLVPMVLGSRRMVQADQIRTSVTQQLRTAANLIGSDIRTAGERFPGRAALELLPIEIISGTGGEPDEIILRRNLWEGTLPLCQSTLSGGSTTITVAAPPNPDTIWNPYPQCIQPYLPGDQWPRNVDEIRELAEAISEDGELRAYLWNPVLNSNAGAGEFFTFAAPPTGMSAPYRQIGRTDGGSWSHTHGIDDRPRIYILEERRYRVTDGMLELIVNGATTSPLRAVAGISQFRARYILDDDSVVSILPDDASWRNIRGVEVMLTSSEEAGRDSMERTMTSVFFPRNVLSR